MSESGETAGIYSVRIVLTGALVGAWLLSHHRDGEKKGEQSALRATKYFHGILPTAAYLVSFIYCHERSWQRGFTYLMFGLLLSAGAFLRKGSLDQYYRLRHTRKPASWHTISCMLIVITQVINNVQHGSLDEFVVCAILSGSLFFISLSLISDIYAISYRTLVQQIPILSLALLLISDSHGHIMVQSWFLTVALVALGAAVGIIVSMDIESLGLTALDLSCFGALTRLFLEIFASSGEVIPDHLLDILALGLCLVILRFKTEAEECNSPSTRSRLLNHEREKPIYIGESGQIKSYTTRTSLYFLLAAGIFWTFVQMYGVLSSSAAPSNSQVRRTTEPIRPFDLAMLESPWIPKAIEWPQIEVGSLFKHTPGATPEQEGKFPRKVGLLAIPAGKQAKDNVDKIVRVMEPHGLDVMIFHYDDADWSDLEWYSRAHSVRVKGVAKLWFAKRFLTKEVVSNYDYIFLWDDDVYFEQGHFDAKRLISNLYKYNIQVAQPAVKNSDWWEIWPTSGNRVGRWVDFVETMCPIYSTKAWISCIQPSIQYHLSTGCGFDLSVFYPCAAQGFCRTALLEQDRMVHLNQKSMTASNKHDDGWSDMCINDLKEGRKFEKAWCDQDPVGRPCRNGTTYTTFRKIQAMDASHLNCPAHQDAWPPAMPVKWS